jgi:hypothetical protein
MPASFTITLSANHCILLRGKRLDCIPAKKLPVVRASKTKKAVAKMCVETFSYEMSLWSENFCHHWIILFNRVGIQGTVASNWQRPGRFFLAKETKATMLPL